MSSRLSFTYDYHLSTQVDLIDMQSFKDGEYAYILVYQDHGIKLCALEALQTKTKMAVALTLLRIFSFIGPPMILQSDNGREFDKVAGVGPVTPLDDNTLSGVVTQLAELWPESKLVHGRARHSQSQGGVERLNQTVQRRLAAWMKDSGSKKWASVGIKLVQWTINTSFTKSIKKVPYELAFGQAPGCGISSLPIAPELLAKIQTEDELNGVVEQLEAVAKGTTKGGKEKVVPNVEKEGGTKGGKQKAKEVPAERVQQADVDAARMLLSELDDERAIFDALGESADELTRKLAARILAMPINTGVDLVFEVSLLHNSADSCADGVNEKILGAEYHPVVLTRSVS